MSSELAAALRRSLGVKHRRRRRSIATLEAELAIARARIEELERALRHRMGCTGWHCPQCREASALLAGKGEGIATPKT